jgi:hypothetical protein
MFSIPDPGSRIFGSQSNNKTEEEGGTKLVVLPCFGSHKCYKIKKLVNFLTGKEKN